jgi:hypothetical protein
VREEHRLRVFENRILRKVFGSERDGVAGNWRKFHSVEHHDLYLSPNTIRVIKRNEMVAADVHAGFWWGNLRERDHLEGLGIDGRIILEWTLKTRLGGC